MQDEFLKKIKKELLTDDNLKTKISNLMIFRSNNEIECIEDIIDDLLNHKGIFNAEFLYGIDEEKLDEWIKKEEKTLRISHDTKEINNSYNIIRKYDRVVIPESVESIESSFNWSSIKEIEFLEPKNNEERGISKINNSFKYIYIEWN